ncbi:MAG: TRAP transporter small permease [Devosia sp.]
MVLSVRSAASALNVVATIWVFVLAFLILADVLGRALFGEPLQGTKEIVANSIVAVVFLQFPLAIKEGALLRSTLILDALPSVGRRTVIAAGHLLGAALFAAMALGGWEDTVIGWRIGEIEGEGALRVPVYPVRTVVLILSAVSTFLFLALFVAALLGRDPETVRHATRRAEG